MADKKAAMSGVEAAMMEELGMNRLESLPMDDGGSSHHQNGRGSGHQTANSILRAVHQPSNVSAPLSSIWQGAVDSGVFYDEDARGVQGLDDLGGGRSYAEHGRRTANAILGSMKMFQLGNSGGAPGKSSNRKGGRFVPQNDRSQHDMSRFGILNQGLPVRRFEPGYASATRFPNNSTFRSQAPNPGPLAGRSPNANLATSGSASAAVFEARPASIKTLSSNNAAPSTNGTGSRPGTVPLAVSGTPGAAPFEAASQTPAPRTEPANLNQQQAHAEEAKVRPISSSQSVDSSKITSAETKTVPESEAKGTSQPISDQSKTTSNVQKVSQTSSFVEPPLRVFRKQVKYQPDKKENPRLATILLCADSRPNLGNFYLIVDGKCIAKWPMNSWHNYVNNGTDMVVQFKEGIYSHSYSFTFRFQNEIIGFLKEITALRDGQYLDEVKEWKAQSVPAPQIEVATKIVPVTTKETAKKMTGSETVLQVSNTKIGQSSLEPSGETSREKSNFPATPKDASVSTTTVSIPGKENDAAALEQDSTHGAGVSEPHVSEKKDSVLVDFSEVEGDGSQSHGTPSVAADLLSTLDPFEWPEVVGQEKNVEPMTEEPKTIGAVLNEAAKDILGLSFMQGHAGKTKAEITEYARGVAKTVTEKWLESRSDFQNLDDTEKESIKREVLELAFGGMDHHEPDASLKSQSNLRSTAPPASEATKNLKSHPVEQYDTTRSSIKQGVRQQYRREEILALRADPVKPPHWLHELGFLPPVERPIPPVQYKQSHIEASAKHSDWLFCARIADKSDGGSVTSRAQSSSETPTPENPAPGKSASENQYKSHLEASAKHAGWLFGGLVDSKSGADSVTSQALASDNVESSSALSVPEFKAKPSHRIEEQPKLGLASPVEKTALIDISSPVKGSASTNGSIDSTPQTPPGYEDKGLMASLWSDGDSTIAKGNNFTGPAYEFPPGSNLWLLSQLRSGDHVNKSTEANDVASFFFRGPEQVGQPKTGNPSTGALIPVQNQSQDVQPVQHRHVPVRSSNGTSQAPSRGLASSCWAN